VLIVGTVFKWLFGAEFIIMLSLLGALAVASHLGVMEELARVLGL